MGSLNNLLLNSANYYKLTEVVGFDFFFNKFQNNAGLYFSMSGIWAAKLSFALLHYLKNNLPAFLAAILSLPCSKHADRYYFLQSRQAVSNQGARCLPHLLGFKGGFTRYALTTPAFSPLSSKKASIAAVLASLDSPRSCNISYIPYLKPSVSV